MSSIRPRIFIHHNNVVIPLSPKGGGHQLASNRATLFPSLLPPPPGNNKDRIRDKHFTWNKELLSQFTLEILATNQASINIDVR